MEILVELMFPLLSERHSLINCTTEKNIFCSDFMEIIFEEKEKEEYIRS